MTSSRTRFWLALAGIALLLMAAGALVVRGFSRRLAGSITPGGTVAGSGTPARTSGPGSASLLERVLSTAVKFGRIEYQGGTSARLERLEIPLGSRGGPVVEIATADLELDVASMSLKGVLDGAPIARGLLSQKLGILALDAAAKLPLSLVAPARSLANFRTWNISANLAGQQIMFRPTTLAEGLPVKISRGRLAYDAGNVRLEGLQLAFGSSRFDVNAGIADVMGPAVFDKSTVTGSLDVLDLLLPRGTIRPKDAQGQLALALALSGAVQKPDVSGDVSGGLNLRRLPVAVETAGVPDRWVNVNFPKVVGKVTGGKDGALLTAEVAVGAGFASLVSNQRQIGFSGDRARAVATVDGAWTAPRVVRSLELTRGVVHYQFASSPGLPVATAAFDYPYDTMRMSTSSRGKQISYHFDTVSPGGGRARFDYELDRARTPAITGYGFDTEAVDVALLTRPLFAGALIARGQLSLKVAGNAERMAVVDMRGTGRGRITGFSLDWPGLRGSLEDLDLADVLRSAVVPVVDVEAPSFGNEVILKLKGQAQGFRLEGQLRVNANLGYIGRFDYTFEPGFVPGNAAAEAALLRRAGAGKLSLKVKGQSPAQPVIELVAP